MSDKKTEVIYDSQPNMYNETYRPKLKNRIIDDVTLSNIKTSQQCETPTVNGIK